MNIYFDCDYTMITWDGRLRPKVEETFRKLKEDGHDIYVWSGVGIRWLEVRRHNLEQYVTDCFHKPLFDYERKMKEFGVDPRPDIIIDDYLEIVRFFGGIRITPYVYEKLDDRDMDKVHQFISSVSSNQGPAFSLIT